MADWKPRRLDSQSSFLPITFRISLLSFFPALKQRLHQTDELGKPQGTYPSVPNSMESGIIINFKRTHSWSFFLVPICLSSWKGSMWFKQLNSNKRMFLLFSLSRCLKILEISFQQEYSYILKSSAKRWLFPLLLFDLVQLFTHPHTPTPVSLICF